MKPLISEFSFGYAITDELINGHQLDITAAPVFPSLYQEGKTGGYDVRLDGPAIPLFLQFKLSHCLKTMNANEAKNGLLQLPYYRMHLRANRYSKQHQLLLELESLGNDVYYCAPAFHTEHELNDYYLGRHMCNQSIWIAPSKIGPLPDDDPHYLAFEDPQFGFAYFCSEPVKIEAAFSFEAFNEKMLQRLRDTNLKSSSDVDDFMGTMSTSMRESSKNVRMQEPEKEDFNVPIGEIDWPKLVDRNQTPPRKRIKPEVDREEMWKKIEALPPIERVASIASVEFDSCLFMVTPKD